MVIVDQTEPADIVDRLLWQEARQLLGLPGSEPVPPGESPGRGTFFAALLQAAGSKFHFVSTRCPSLLVTSSTHFFASPRCSAPSRAAMG